MGVGRHVPASLEDLFPYGIVSNRVAKNGCFFQLIEPFEARSYLALVAVSQVAHGTVVCVDFQP